MIDVHRVEICNKILKKISDYSRRFFLNPGTHIATFLIKKDKLYYEDEYQRKQIWMKPKQEPMPHHFNHGGNLWGLIQEMRDFIYDGKKRIIFSRYWGYDFDSLVIIHTFAQILGFVKNSDFTIHNYGEERDEIYKSGELTYKNWRVEE